MYRILRFMHVSELIHMSFVRCRNVACMYYSLVIFFSYYIERILRFLLIMKRSFITLSHLALLHRDGSTVIFFFCIR